MSLRSEYRTWMLVFMLLCGGAILTSALVIAANTRGYDTLLMLADINAGDKPSRFKATTASPARGPITYTAWGQTYTGDLYLPGRGSPEAGIVLVPGVVRNAKDDPRLVAFATTLARAKFAVLVPDLTGFQTLQVRSDDAMEIEAAFSYLVGRIDLAPGGRAGITALSYAVGISVLAALDEHIRDRVRFILGVGGYYDITEAITFLTTGYFRKDGQWQHIQPDPYAARVFLKSCEDVIQNSSDRALLEAIEERKMQDRTIDSSALASHLGPEGRPLYELLVNSDPQRTPGLIALLPEAIRDNLSKLDLSNKDLTHLKAHLLLLADPADSMIPYTQSLELARAVPEGRAQVHLVRSLTHVEVKRVDYFSWKFLTTGVSDFRNMYLTIYALLGERG
jgi:hypothetical protein